MNEPVIDLNAAFGKALLDQFFPPTTAGTDPNGQPYYVPSGLSVLAQEIFTKHGKAMAEQVWGQIDKEALAQKVADLVVAELTRVPGRFDAPNAHRAKLTARVMEIAAQQLGQRVVDAMDLRLGDRELAAAPDATP